MKALAFLSAMLLAAPAFAQDQAVSAFHNPESVVSFGTQMYVSNLGMKLDPMTKDGDGFIALVNGNGTISNPDFITGLNAPKGMVVVGKTLYVADVDVLRGYDLESRKEIFHIDFSAEQTNFLNDIAVMDDHHLLLSATDINKVFVVDTSTVTYKALTTKKPVLGPNGIAYDAKHHAAYVAGFVMNDKSKGHIYKLQFDKENNVFAEYELPGVSGYLDGIALLTDGNLIVSEWGDFQPGQGQLVKVYTVGGKTEILENNLSGPADFIVTEQGKKITVVLPQMISNQVKVHSYPN